MFQGRHTYIHHSSKLPLKPNIKGEGGGGEGEEEEISPGGVFTLRGVDGDGSL